MRAMPRGSAIAVERIPMPTPMFITAEEAAGIDATPRTA